MTDNGTIFIGGTVFAGPQQTPTKNVAIYATDGVIREIGAPDDIRRAHAGARVIDASSATILPGLIDAHGHLYGLGLSLDIVRLVDTTSYEQVIALVKERAARASANEWILGRGWDQNDWDVKQFPTAAPLDAAVSDHPVWLKRIDGHAGLANSAAMRAAGVTAATKDPDGGRVERDANGNPTGVFVDAAMDLVESAVPPPTFAQRKARVLAAAQKIASEGLVETHDPGADDATIRAVRELIDEKKFPIRVYSMLSDSGEAFDSGNAQLRDWFARGPLLDYGGRLTVRAVKVYADGALGSRGAALLAPYSDDPKNVGLMLAKPEHIADVAKRALAAGFQVNTHAIGDRGVRNVIDAYQEAGVKPEHRFRIEHLQVISPPDVPRLVYRGIIASMQPTHATSDMYWAEKRLGDPRVRDSYAWRTVLNAGGRLALGSDFPVEEVNPFYGISSAVTRQDHKNWPDGGWFPDQRLTFAEALRGFTLDAAYAGFEEKSRGTIEAGKLADFTIVEGDFATTPPQDLWKAKVRSTVVGGEVVWSSTQK
ncbi:MAG TPA: amidohydrolase [Thermoanaerobaculia bacterium]|nr:amidohydrolase [Thermoanaerobaculia bacterium]